MSATISSISANRGTEDEQATADGDGVDREPVLGRDLGGQGLAGHVGHDQLQRLALPRSTDPAVDPVPTVGLAGGLLRELATCECPDSPLL